MNAHVILQNDFTRVKEWNDGGFTGKNFVVWNMEGSSDHGSKTKSRILDVVPDAKVINRPLSLSMKGDEVTAAMVYDDDTHLYISPDEFINKHGIRIANCSAGQGRKDRPGRIQWFKEFQRRHNLVFFNSAGNDGSMGVLVGKVPAEVSIFVGACIMFQLDPKDIRMAYYSSIGYEFEKVDFSTFTGSFEGTSFASPYLAGMAILLQERYGEMSQAEIYNYFKMIAQPIDTNQEPDVITEFPGGIYLYDQWSGYGVPILPPLDMRYITMTVGSKRYFKDGVEHPMDAAPFVKDDKTFVPIAFVAEALGAKVSWNALQKKVTIERGEAKIELFIGKDYYIFNGWRYSMTTAPFIKDKRTFVPISYVALALGCRVSWCNEEKKVQILEVDHMED